VRRDIGRATILVWPRVVAALFVYDHDHDHVHVGKN